MIGEGFARLPGDLRGELGQGVGAVPGEFVDLSRLFRPDEHGGVDCGRRAGEVRSEDVTAEGVPQGDDRAVVETYVAGRPMKPGMRPAN